MLLVLAVVVPVVGGCATRQASVEGDHTFPAALSRDVAEADRHFPYGLAPVLYGTATFAPLAAPDSAIQQR